MDPTDRELAAAARKVVRHESALERARDERDRLIRAALAAGAGPTRVSRVTGLAVQRIYQIRHEKTSNTLDRKPSRPLES